MKIRYFAWMKRMVGTGDEQVDLPAEVRTVGDLVVWLRKRSTGHAEALADGAVIDTSPLPPPGRGAWTPGPQARLASGLLEIATRHREAIDRHQPKTRRNASGYSLREAVGDSIDLAQVLVGSEGTLGLILDSILRIVPIPKVTATALALFDDLEKAGAAVVEILTFDPSAVELLDRTFVQVIREADPKTGATLPDGTEAILIIELEGDDAREVNGRMDRLAAALTGGRNLDHPDLDRRSHKSLAAYAESSGHVECARIPRRGHCGGNRTGMGRRSGEQRYATVDRCISRRSLSGVDCREYLSPRRSDRLPQRGCQSWICPPAS